MRTRLLPLILMLTSTPVAQPSTGRLEIDLLLDWESVSSPRMSPDGARVVFTRGWVDKVNDRRQSDLWVVESDGSRPRFLTEGSSPRWSPDGTRVAFLKRGEPEGSQLHVLWMDTREVTQITRVAESIRDVRWSPDGRRIAFRMLVPEKEPFVKIELPPKPKGAKWAEEPKVVSRLSYRRDRSGYRPKGFHHLFVVDAEGGTERQVTSGDFDHGGGEWTRDGARLIFSGLRAEDADWQIAESELYAVDVDDGEVKQLTSRRGPDGSPAVSPDGRHIAYTGADWKGDTYHVSKLYVMPVDGGEPRLLTADLDRQVSGPTWTRDGDAILFSVATEGSRHLYRATLDGEVEPVTTGPLSFRFGDVTPDGGAVGVLATSSRPGDLAIVDPDGAHRRLTRVNDDLLDHVALGTVEEIRYPSTDDLEIQGWIVKPPDFDPAKKYPLILQIHGGPHGMYGVDFSFERQNHVAEGFVVLYTNPRGSDGYGKAFGNAINNAYPGMDYDDLMRGVDEVIARGYIDEDNLFVYGGSGGGVLTCWIVGMTDRFKAAVSMFPVTNWISFVGTTDGPYWYHNFKQYPWEGIEEHWRRSPLRLVGNVTTPTMLITGELDLRTPMAQTEEYYQALKWRKIDTAMVRIPDEYHGAAGRHASNQLRRILYVRAWFDRYKGEDEEPPTDAP